MLATDNLQGADMGFIDQVNPNPALTPATEPPLADDRPVEPQLVATRVNWLFSGVLLGAAGWLLVLAVIFAALGAVIVAGALLGACGLGLLTVWRAGRRLRRVF